MNGFQTASVVLTGAALAAYANHRLLKLPTTIGMMVFSLLLSLVGITLQYLGLIDFNAASNFLKTIDFSSLLLHGMLSLLLFAGALHIDLADLRRVRVMVITMATVGVFVSAAVTGTLIWLAASVLGFPIDYLYALLFGALIAPTDPIAVLSILKSVGVSRRFYAKIGGESLFNDGVGVVAFITILGIATSAQSFHAPQVYNVAFDLARQILGGGLLGGLAGWGAYMLVRSIDDYKIEVMLTLALATGVYGLAEAAAFSAPIAVAVAGLIIGHHGRATAMSETTRNHLDLFWELLDEVLNGVLFVLMGLVLMIVPITGDILAMGGVAIVAVLAGRWVSVSIPILVLRFVRPRLVERGTIRLLTWGGLRGGISIALALSLPEGPDKELLLAMTYIVVVFSVLVQGLSFGWAARRILRKKLAQPLVRPILPSESGADCP